MITPQLVKEQINLYYEPAKKFIEVEYLKRTNKIMTNHILEKANLFNEGKFLQALTLDINLKEKLSKENLERDKAIDYYYLKSVKTIFEMLRSLDFDYSYQMEVQRAFASDNPLSMYNCKIGAVYYK